MNKKLEAIRAAAYTDYVSAICLLADAWLTVLKADPQPLQFGSCALGEFDRQIRDYRIRLKLEREIIL